MLTKKLSRVGFGAYRISIKSAEHHQALESALQLGENLIDTSANYCDGDSELWILLEYSPKIAFENSPRLALV